jgi:hypothetical protein
MWPGVTIYRGRASSLASHESNVYSPAPWLGSGAGSVGPLIVLVAWSALKGPCVVQIVGFAQRINLRCHELDPARIRALDTAARMPERAHPVWLARRCTGCAPEGRWSPVDQLKAVGHHQVPCSASWRTGQRRGQRDFSSIQALEAKRYAVMVDDQLPEEARRLSDSPPETEGSQAPSPGEKAKKDFFRAGILRASPRRDR